MALYATIQFATSRVACALTGEQLNQLLAIENAIQNNKKIKRKSYVVATIRYGIHIFKAEIAWCDETKKLLTT